jgi:sugar phosphate isomerase/epimerase
MAGCTASGEPNMRRREFLAAMGAAGTATALQGAFTEFQIACMTLPYGAFPLERAIEGIAKAGYKYMAFGHRHQNEEIIAVDAPPSRLRDLAKRARDVGTEPVMMFGVYYIEQPAAVETYKLRIEQAAAARIPYILAFGSPGASAGDYSVCVRTCARSVRWRAPPA